MPLFFKRIPHSYYLVFLCTALLRTSFLSLSTLDLIDGCSTLHCIYALFMLRVCSILNLVVK